MTERKVLLFVITLIIYCFYCAHTWFSKSSKESNIEGTAELLTIKEPEKLIENVTKEVIKNEVVKIKISLFYYNACSILDIFTKKPESVKRRNTRAEDMDTSHNTITMIGITVFLLVVTANAILDVIRVREEEKAKRKLNPHGERRQSLAEFANKKTLRRESSKFNFQLFQIAESSVNTDEEKPSNNKRPNKPYKRGDSTNSYLSENKNQDNSASPKINEAVTKVFGARPAPMVRRSSFPALPLNPDIQAIMLGHRQSSVDSDDEDSKGKRVRIIRRY